MSRHRSHRCRSVYTRVVNLRLPHTSLCKCYGSVVDTCVAQCWLLQSGTMAAWSTAEGGKNIALVTRAARESITIMRGAGPKWGPMPRKTFPTRNSFYGATVNGASRMLCSHINASFPPTFVTSTKLMVNWSKEMSKSCAVIGMRTTSLSSV